MAVIVAIGVWALSGQTNTNNTGTSSSSIHAGAIINTGLSHKMEYDRLRITYPTSTINMIPGQVATSSSQNIYEPTTGIQQPIPSPNVLRSGVVAPEGIWLKQLIEIPGQGTTGIPEMVVSLAGIKDSVCQRINYSIYGINTIPSIPTIPDGFNFVVSGTLANPNATMRDFSAVSAITGWSAGCVSANGLADNNLYFQVLRAF